MAKQTNLKILAIFCLVFFVLYLIITILYYNTGTEIVSLSLKSDDSHFNLPKWHLCVMVDFPIFEDGNLLNKVSDALEKLKGDNVRWNVLNKEWDYVMVPVLYKYFAAVEFVETKFGPQLNITSPYMVYEDALRPFLNKTGDQKIKKFIEKILIFTRKNSVSDTELRKKLANEIVHLINLELQVSRINNRKKWRKLPMNLAFFAFYHHKHSTCFDFDAPRVGEIAEFTTDVGNLKRRVGETTGRAWDRSQMNKFVSFYIASKPDISLTSLPDVRTPFGSQQRAEVQLTAVYKKSNKKVCSSNCFTTCQSTYIQNQCDCVPIMTESTQGQHCTLDDYLTYLKKAQTLSLNQCSKQCSHECTSFSYLVKRLGNEGVKLDNLKAHTLIRISSAPFPVYSKRTWIDNLWIHAGIAGALLGLFVLTVVLSTDCQKKHPDLPANANNIQMNALINGSDTMPTSMTSQGSHVYAEVDQKFA